MTRRAAAAPAFPDGLARLRATLAADPRADAAVVASLGALDWAAALPNAAAPGFVYLAGAVGGTAVGGGGRDLAEAAGRLAGEACEVAAQRGPLPAPCDLALDPALRALWGDGPALAARDLGRGGVIGAPMAAIFPAVPAAPAAPPRSLGLAAGRDREAALLSALLELIERDAAAAWWSGEVRPRGVDLADAGRAAADLAALRAGAAAPRRATALMTLPSPTGLPVVCALSRDGTGAGLAFGLKAALDPARAVAGAVIELLQMEIALEIARLRAAGGRATPADAVPLGLAALDPDAFDAFAPLPPAAAAAPAPEGAAALAAHLAALGLGVAVVDLDGPPGGLAVAKAFVAGLRALPAPAARPGAPGATTALMR